MGSVWFSGREEGTQRRSCGGRKEQRRECRSPLWPEVFNMLNIIPLANLFFGKSQYHIRYLTNISSAQ
jgi:hypothetical protein